MGHYITIEVAIFLRQVIIKITVDNGIDYRYLSAYLYRAVTILSEHLNDTLTKVKSRLRIGIEIRTELREFLKLSVL